MTSTSTMFSGKGFLVGLTILVVTLWSIDQGYALECYVCDSLNDINCKNDIKDKGFEKNCTDVDEWVQFVNPLDPKNAAENRTDAECVTITELKRGKNDTISVLRTCMPTGVTDTYLKAHFKLHGVEIGSVKYCKKDLCNSSSSTYAGILSLLVSTMLLFFMK